jgi:hypothetical protein
VHEWCSAGAVSHACQCFLLCLPWLAVLQIREAGGSKAVERHTSRGKLLARQRIDQVHTPAQQPALTRLAPKPLALTPAHAAGWAQPDADTTGTLYGPSVHWQHRPVCVCVYMRMWHACVLLQLLDEGSPFLELSPLAGKELYGE